MVPVAVAKVSNAFVPLLALEENLSGTMVLDPLAKFRAELVEESIRPDPERTSDDEPSLGKLV